MTDYEQSRGVAPNSLIETFPVETPAGLVWQGRLYQTRTGGRRILLLDHEGVLRHDTLSHADKDNAVADLDDFLTAILQAWTPRHPPPKDYASVDDPQYRGTIYPKDFVPPF